MKNIRKSKPFFLSVSALLVLLNLGYASKTPAFKSKLFESGNLLISDDFDQGKWHVDEHKQGKSVGSAEFAFGPL